MKNMGEEKLENKENSGNCNSGNRNSGNSNSGNTNSGDCNSGNRNSGNTNSGYWNSGDSNSGDSNSGYSNSGNWNSGNWNSGYFNIDIPKVRIFGLETEVKRGDIIFPDYLYFSLTNWIDFDDMSDQEKKENSFAEYTNGYLKIYEYKEAFMNSFNVADLDDIKKTLELPNFDYEIFETISGISKDDFDRRLNGDDTIKIINGKKYKLVEED